MDILTNYSGLAINHLGMGGEILLVTRGSLPDKYRLIFDFSDGTCLAINFCGLVRRTTHR
jgi:hypothetical protein